MKRRFLFAAVIFTLACGQQNQPKETTQTEHLTVENETQPEVDVKQDESSVNEVSVTETDLSNQRMAEENNKYFPAFLEIHKALESGDFQIIDKYIDVNTGLYVIYSNGAMPKAAHIYKIEQFKAISSYTFKELAYDFKEEDLPKVVCENNPYNKQGIFGNPVNFYAENPVWEYTDLNEKEKQAAQFAAQQITYTIINTEGYVYCFGEINGNVRLLFIDLRIPCSA